MTTKLRRPLPQSNDMGGAVDGLQQAVVDLERRVMFIFDGTVGAV